MAQWALEIRPVRLENYFGGGSWDNRVTRVGATGFVTVAHH